METEQAILVNFGTGRASQACQVQFPSNHRLIAAAQELKRLSDGKQVTSEKYSPNCVGFYQPIPYKVTEFDPLTGERSGPIEAHFTDVCMFYFHDGKRATAVALVSFDKDPPTVGLLPSTATLPNSDEVVPVPPALSTEGKATIVELTRFERDPMLRTRCLQIHGAQCAVCGIDFGATYGDCATGLIHVHHLTPLANIRTEHDVDPANDLVPVCPNCHSVMHLKDPPYTPAQVRVMLADQR